MSRKIYEIYGYEPTVKSMKICVASDGNAGLEDTVSAQFGRCPTFVVVEIEGQNIKGSHTIVNPGSTAASGAGIQAAQAVIDAGCSVIIASSIGPNSSQALQMAGVEMRKAPQIKVRDAILKYIREELPPAQPSSGVGPGMGRGRGMGRGMGRRRRW